MMQERHHIDQRKYEVTFLGAYIEYWVGAFDFKGYTSRRGYFYVLLWDLVILWLLGIIFIGSLSSTFSSSYYDYSYDYGLSTLFGSMGLLAIVYFVFIFPGLALSTRRYRDAGITDKGILTIFLGLFLGNFVPIIGWIIYIGFVFFALFIIFQGSGALLTDKPDSFFFRQRSTATGYDNLQQSPQGDMALAEKQAQWIGYFKAVHGRSPFDDEIAVAKRQGFVLGSTQTTQPSMHSLVNNQQEVQSIIQSNHLVPESTVPMMTSDSREVEKVDAVLLSTEKETTGSLYQELVKEPTSSPAIEDTSKRTIWLEQFRSTYGRQPSAQEFFDAKQAGYPTLNPVVEEVAEEIEVEEISPLQEAWVELFQILNGREPNVEELAEAKSQNFGRQEEVNTDSAKAEWLAYFQAVNGRDPSPREFLQAKNKGFSLAEF